MKENTCKRTKQTGISKAELQRVMPKELEASEINVRLGATWIPPKDIERFIFETLKTQDMQDGILKSNFHI